MKAEEFKAKQQKAYQDNNMPDIDGNTLMFGQRKQCINPSLLNDERGGRKYAKPDFYDLNRVKKYWR